MKKKHLIRELEDQVMWAGREKAALAEQVRGLRAANTELVNNFTGEAAQLRYERTAALEEIAELKERVHYWESVTQGWIRIAREVGDMLTEAVAEATELYDDLEYHRADLEYCNRQFIRVAEENARLRNGETV
jgi:predicted nuclease with TOPRIM domain